jgi:hypothetical protein
LKASLLKCDISHFPAIPMQCFPDGVPQNYGVLGSENKRSTGKFYYRINKNIYTFANSGILVFVLKYVSFNNMLISCVC